MTKLLTAIGNFTLSTENLSNKWHYYLMLKTKVSTILLFLAISLTAAANEFKFNYKNLNTLTAVICHKAKNTLSQQKGAQVVSSFSINKVKHSDQKDDATFEISGTCNAVIAKNRSVLSYGQEIQLTINLNKLNQSKGMLGISPITLQFFKGIPTQVIIEDLLLSQQLSLTLNSSRWAKSNSLFSLNPENYIQIKSSSRIIASEVESNLEFLNNSTFYNIWSYESFGCSGKEKISSSQCEKLTTLI
ncbi:MAG: hypothetical protein HON90_14025 [Halobacteriovoraceae bacterium]|jgi:hypothetical protein|nr:hypothetical protein [Halobacteriovoraceae bacterium]